MRRCFDALFPSIERMLSATKPYLRVSSVEIDAISSARCPSVRARSRTPARMHVCVCVRVAVWLSGCLFSLAHDLSLLSLSLTLSLSHSLSRSFSLTIFLSLTICLFSLSLSVLLTFLRLCKALLISRLQHALVKVCGANTKGCSESVLACRCTHACACMRVHDTDTAFEP